MSLNLTPGAPPVFLTKNYFSGDANNYGGTFSAGDNAALGPRVYDMDPFAFWASIDATDGTHQIVSSQLYEGYGLASRVVGLVALLNINLANFVLSYSTDGGSTWTVLSTVTGNTASTYVLDLSAAPVTMNAFKVDATTTITANQAKQIGTIVLCGVLFQPSASADKIKRTYFDNQRIVALADGSEDITYIKRSPASHEFYGCQLSFSFLSDTDIDGIRTVRRANPNCCLYPEPGDRAGDIFYGRFDGNWSDEQATLWKGAGRNTIITFKETTS